MTIKQIIILYKRSAYSIYFQRPYSSFRRRAQISAEEMKRFQRMHDTHYACLNEVERIVKKYGIPCKKVHRGRKFAVKPHDMVVTVGGDGTFLEGARALKGQIILGVNSDPSWSVGRFCFATVKNFEFILQAILNGKQNISLFPRIELRAAGKRFNVLNDVLFSHHNPAAMSRYCLTVGNIKEEQKSSGVWISTAAGSSGAIKSAGGKKLRPTEKIIQYRPRELYVGKNRVYRLKGGAVIKSNISITSMMREGYVFVDGSHVSLAVGFGEEVRIAPSPFPLKVVCNK